MKVPYNLGQLGVDIGGSNSFLAPHSTRCSSAHCSNVNVSSVSRNPRPFPQVLSSATPSLQCQYLSQLKYMYNKFIILNLPITAIRTKEKLQKSF